jgi:surface antigen
MISSNKAAIAVARATQAAINANVNRTGGGVIIDGGLLSDYPWNSSNCWMSGFLSNGGSNGIGGDGYGYGCRQCASYVAWKIAKETNFYPQWGNAQDFYSAAIAKFGAGDGRPHAGSIAVMSGATAGNIYYGHVAWVETDPYINSAGRTVIQVSQYNYNYGAGYGMYSLVEWSVNAFDYYVQIVK